MQFLIAADSVHTTAAACDYLHDRLGSDDSVTVVTVPDPDSRDGDDALNVAHARLAGVAEVETERLGTDADPARAVLTAATDREADVIVIGPHAGVPDAEPSLGNTARRITEAAEVPVVVVPLST